ncbi:signal transducer and activator of transcription 2 [Chanos chanos]|uniref:Signal transducer and activator of transcription n=1 Tax=Chanos chanos TaxID=29144 RepID=A0A6J2VR67_CHACN|nr:signal transducer and activator of transcription 3-like [Chanos chanos]
MSQWERLKQLDLTYLQRVDELYSREEFPMDVRHYLAHWIESQDWERASREQSRALLLFQILLENMDIQFSRFTQEKDTFLMQRNFKRFKQNFQKFQERPYDLAAIIHWFLMKEREILKDAEVAEQMRCLEVQPSSVEMDTQRQMDRTIQDLKSRVQVMEHTVKSLEEQQDEFDFKFQTHQMEGTTDEMERRRQTQALQQMLNMLDQSRKVFLSDLTGLLDFAEELLCVLVEKELVEWSRRLQVSCIGAPEDTSLDLLEKWFTAGAECLFQMNKFLQKLDELLSKVTYDKDPIKAQRPSLQKRVNELLNKLLKSSFVVETQPSMPQGRGPLVLRTNVQFSVKTRLLVKIPELNHAMKVTVSIDKEPPQVKGYRRFNVLGTSCKALNMAESMSGGMVADFRHLTLKEQKIGGGGKGMNDLSLSVTEELHIIHFDTQFEFDGLSVPLEASSLPVVVISNSSQQQSAWAAVLWFNTLCLDPKNVLFFASSPVAPWSQFGAMLSWQFLSCAKRGLEAEQLHMIAQKLFGKQTNYDTCKITWNKFSKENVPDMNFTFWVWLDGILNLVKNNLADLWSDGSIIGFISKVRERNLLRKKQRGTFLLRFSESIRDGGITFSWVDYSTDGKPNVRTVKPFTKTDLNQIPFPEIIRHFQIHEENNVPVNPLQHLYPDIPKDQAFGKYFSDTSGEDSPYIKYIRTKLMFVSQGNGCAGVAEGKSSGQISGEAAGPPGCEAIDDVMVWGSENSPMFSSPVSDAFLEAHPALSPTSTFPSSVPEDFPNSVPEDFSRDITEVLLNDMRDDFATDHSSLQDFLSDPNLFSDIQGLQDMGLPAAMPLSP